ncbi:MAG: hypothetical protein H6705_10620 [Myxococcales bacterium]|nr:hypothetical protein [Myxococcales bacterium]
MIDHRRIFRAVAFLTLAGALALPALADAATETEACLMAWNGAHYVVSEDNQYSVNANRGACGPWEKHAIIDLDDGDLRHGDRVAIRSTWNRYWSAQPNGRLEANRAALGPWEVFVIHKVTAGDAIIRDGDQLALRSEAFNHYIVAENAGGSVVNANRGALGPWETFRIQHTTPPPPADATLRVTQPGDEAIGAIDGTGGIWSTCRPHCQVTLPVGTAVTLQASTVGNNAIEFDRWTGACAGQGVTCTFTLGATGADVALYMRQKPTHASLTIRRQGDGRIDDVTVDPVGDVWWETTRQYAIGTELVITPHDDTLHNATFTGWGAACAGIDPTEDCVITLNGNTTVDVHYVQGPTHLLRVTQPGDDAIGAVRGTDGIWSTCRPGCDRRLAPGTVVTLQADTVGQNISFDHWTGACAGQGPTCTFTLDGPADVALSMRPN